MAERAGGIAVIGAGPAGLAAAWSLRESGRSVRVYEARDRPGGRLRTETVAEVRADVAVQLLSDGYTRTRLLVERLGLADRLVEVPGRDAVWRQGRPHELRYGSVTSLAASGALPAKLKLRLGLRYLPFLERHAGVLDLNAPARAAEAGLDRESIAEWGKRELGAEFVELLVYPLLAAYYGAVPEETSAALFHGLAAAGRHVRVLGIHGGAGLLAGSMAAALGARGVDVRPGAPVESIEADDDGVRVVVAGETFVHDGAVVAVPADEAARLVPGADWLSAIRTRSTAVLVLALDRRLSTGWFGLSLPRTEPGGRRVAAVCVQSEKGTGLGGTTGDALLVVPAPAEGERWAEMDPRSVLDVALPVVERLLPGTRARVREARLVRLAGAVVPVPGHFERMARRPDPTVAPGVVLAGDYLVAPTVEGAVRSGLAAAGRLTRGAGAR